jgi:hypothetical protein
MVLTELNYVSTMIGEAEQVRRDSPSVFKSQLG